jgi:type II secretory pathway pseudopilin PulG
MQRVSPPAQHFLLHDRAAAGRATDTSPGRRGVALLSAIVCVVIMSAVAASLLRSVLAQVREADRQAFQLQAEALAQSALQRGYQQRTTNPSYLGEVWTPDVAGAPKLKAEIEWTSAATGGTLRVVCLVPADAKLPVRLERTAFLPSPTPVKAE